MNDLGHAGYLNRLQYTPRKNSFLEIWKYVGIPNPSFVEGELDETDLHQWLNSKPPENQGALCGGLRIIISSLCFGDEEYFYNGISWTKQNYEAILNSFRLPLRYSKLLAESDTMFASFHPNDQGSTHGRFAYIFSTSAGYSPYWNAAASYDPATGITYALVRCMDIRQQFAKLKSLFVAYMKDAAKFILHPLLPPTLILDLTTSQNALDATATLKNLTELENETGQRFYIHTAARKIDPLALDFSSIITRLNGCSTLIRYLEKVAERNILALQQIIVSFDEILGDNLSPTHVTTHMNAVSSGLKRQVKFLLISNENAKSRLKYDQLGTQTQLNVVYNFIAQRDNNINIKIARTSKSIAVASKRDSSSMKTLSVLTMFFLPGTFATAFFAMPLFDWNNSKNGGIVTHHFWIYWAVTAPLTLLVFATWAIWNRLRTRTQEAEDDEAKREDIFAPEKGGQ